MLRVITQIIITIILFLCYFIYLKSNCNVINKSIIAKTLLKDGTILIFIDKISLGTIKIKN